MKSALLFTALAVFCAATDLPAQDQKAPPRKLRLMAVGHPPPFEQEYRNGIRYEKEAVKGTIPPRQIEVAAGDASSTTTRLALRETTEPFRVPGEATQVSLSAGGRVWHALKLPEGGDYLAVLWRDPEAKSWDKARSTLVPEGPGKFDEGDVRFISLTAVPIRFQIKGSPAFDVPPGKTVTRKLGVVAGIETIAHYLDPKDGWKVLWSSALVQNPGERSTVLVYLNDSIDPRKSPTVLPLTVLPIRERTAPAPPPPPDANPDPAAHQDKR